MKEISSSPLVNLQNLLGEGPMWHNLRNTLMWVDIEGQKIFECDIKTSEVNSWEIGYKVSLIVETLRKDEVLLAIQGNIVKYNLSTSTYTEIAELEKGILALRTNDGSVDPLGRLWIGTMDLDCKPGAGSLYSMSKDKILQKEIEGTTISNGMVWTIDKQKLYYIDSATYTVKSFEFNKETGKIRFVNDVVKIPESLGMPDGMCQDVNGMLWIAVWGGFGIYCYDPNTGEQVAKISIPAPQVTSCTFGGANNDLMFITTARKGLSMEDLEKYPLSGATFVAQPGVVGQKRFSFVE